MPEFVYTSHIAQESIEEIEQAFQEYQPDIVAVELDPQRLQALQMQQRNYSPRLIFTIGITGYLFMLLGSYMQNKLGDAVGMRPGEEMLTAYRMADERNIPVALIDQPVEQTLKRVSSIPFSEKLAIAWELVKAPFVRTPYEIDLSEVPSDELIAQLTEELHSKFPNLYQALLIERNHVMASNIRHLQRTNPESDILVVMGAGHKDVEKLL